MKIKNLLITGLAGLMIAGASVGGYYGYTKRDTIKSWFSSHSAVTTPNTNLSSDELRSALAEYKSKLSAEEKKSANLQQELNSARQENSKISEELEQLTEKNTEINGKIAELEQTVNENTEELSNLQSQKLQLENEKTILEQQITQNNSKIQELQQNVEQNETEISNLEQQNSQLTNEKTGLEQQINEKDTKIHELESEITEKTGEISNLNSQLTTANSRISELEQSVSEKEDTISDLREQLQTSQEKVSSLELQVSQLQEQLNSSATSDLAQKIIDRSITEIKASDLEGVTKIGDYAFYGCKSLQNVELPSSITSIGQQAFKGCARFITIRYLGTLEDYLNIQASASFCSDIHTLYINDVNVSGVLNIPIGVTQIGDYLFEGDVYIDSVIIPSTVTYIGKNNFSDAGLRNVTFSDGLETIASYAFRYNNFNDLVIPDTVSSIGYYSFYQSNNLTNLTLGSGITSLDRYSFGSCDKLTNLTIKNSYVYNLNLVDYNFNHLTTVKVLKSVVDDESNTNEYLNNESNFTKSTDGDYYVYTKVS